MDHSTGVVEGAGEQGVFEVRHQHTQGVTDGKMLEKCCSSGSDWPPKVCRGGISVNALIQSLFLLACNSKSHTGLSASTRG